MDLSRLNSSLSFHYETKPNLAFGSDGFSFKNSRRKTPKGEIETYRKLKTHLDYFDRCLRYDNNLYFQKI